MSSNLIKQENHDWELPHLKEYHKIQGVKTETTDGDFYSVKFYPYTEPGIDPVFAVVGGRLILIGRPPAEESGSTEWTKFVVNKGDDGDDDHYACAWSKDLKTGTPWLCVGGKYGKIHIVNALTGELLRTLIGHGGDVVDLNISPINPHILASASADSTVRIWSLDPEHAQPCAAILGGDGGHRSEVFSIAFHSNGRYIISGGTDQVINIWTLPIFPDANTGTENPTHIHYPHFSSSDIASQVVDCVAFHGDLILTKSTGPDGEGSVISLLSITNFSSHSPIPKPSSAPTTHDTTRTTRSSFFSTPIQTSTGISNTPAFLRLLTFATHDAETEYTRFSLFPGSATSGPILAFCNQASKIFFWDLDRLTTYYDWQATTPWELRPSSPSSSSEIEAPSSSSNNHSRPKFLTPFQRRVRGGGHLISRLSRRETSPTESISTNDSHNTGTNSSSPVKGNNKDPVSGKTNVDWETTGEKWGEKYEMRDAFKGVKAHGEEVVKAVNFTGRQVAWSGDGEWCIVCGSGGVVALWRMGV